MRTLHATSQTTTKIYHSGAISAACFEASAASVLVEFTTPPKPVLGHCLYSDDLRNNASQCLIAMSNRQFRIARHCGCNEPSLEPRRKAVLQTTAPKFERN